jgi:branched-chain amino acid transport system substrate-binding protein
MLLDPFRSSILISGAPIQRSLFLLCFLAACNSTDDPIRIGILGPLTTNDGSPMKNAAILAAEEINRAGGINGRRLELVERDDFGNADSAVRAAGELAESDVVAVVGSVYSSITLTVAPIFNGSANPVVQISPSSSSPAISQAGPYTFRICPSDLAHGGALARFARERLNLSRAAVIYQNDEYGRGMRRAFLEEFTRLGGTILGVDPYLQVDGVPAPYFQRLVEGVQPQFIFVAGMAREGGQAMRIARGLGLDAAFMGGDGLSDLADTDPVAEGTFISVAYLEDQPSPRNLEFVQRYHARWPNSAALNKSGAGAYEAIYLLKEIIERAGPNRRRIRDALAEVGNSTPAYDGLTGKIAFDENGDVPNLPVVVGVVRQGALRAVE